MSEITIRRVTVEDEPEWLRMRLALWPDSSPDVHSTGMDAMISDPMQPIFVVVRENDKLCGFLEADIRDHAEDRQTTVGNFEDWYVDADIASRVWVRHWCERRKTGRVRRA